MVHRRLAPAFVVTASAISMTACSEPGLPGNPPRPDPLPPSAQPPSLTLATSEPTSEQVAPSTSPPTTATAPPTSVIVNPTSAEGRHVMRAYQGDGCFVYLPFPPLRDGEMRPPGSAPPTKTVPCPKAMADPAYETCRGGVIERRGDGCRCMESGNPPRIMANACPAEAPAP